MEELFDCVMLCIKMLIRYYNCGQINEAGFADNVKVKIRFLEKNLIQLQAFNKRLEAERLINDCHALIGNSYNGSLNCNIQQ